MLTDEIIRFVDASQYNSKSCVLDLSVTLFSIKFPKGKCYKVLIIFPAQPFLKVTKFMHP